MATYETEEPRPQRQQVIEQYLLGEDESQLWAGGLLAILYILICSRKQQSLSTEQHQLMPLLLLQLQTNHTAQPKPSASHATAEYGG